jgi:hypothetical protein
MFKNSFHNIASHRRKRKMSLRDSFIVVISMRRLVHVKIDFSEPHFQISRQGNIISVSLREK